MYRTLLLLAGPLLLGMTGCCNWGGCGYPMNSMSRVPPPGTGSYPMPGSYYNNPVGMQSGFAPDMSPTRLASQGESPVVTAQSTDTAAASAHGSMTAQDAVQPQPAAGGQGVATAGYSSEPPSLQWKP